MNKNAKVIYGFLRAFMLKSPRTTFKDVLSAVIALYDYEAQKKEDSLVMSVMKHLEQDDSNRKNAMHADDDDPFRDFLMDDFPEDASQ